MFNILAFLKEHRNGLTALIFLILAVTLLISARATSSGMNILNQMVMDATGMVQQYLLLPLDLVQGGRDRIQEMARLAEENQAMKDELLQLRPTGTAMEELRQENQRLRRLLDMPLEPGYRRLVARVVGESSSAFSRSFLINSGSFNGLTMDSVAVNDAGLAGRVVQLGEQTALVLALPDLNSRVPVLAQRSRVQGIITGSNGLHLELNYVPTGADIEEGDTLLTSGADGIFPKGLKVGTVESISSQADEGLFLKITVHPAVDFSRIEEVAILLPLPPMPVPPERAPPPPAKAPRSPQPVKKP